MIQTIFLDFGLTNYETKIYLSLVELGESTTGEILKKADIHSGKIYQILESLKKKGFVSEVIKNGVRKYYPTKPERILEFFDEKRKKISVQEIAFKKILPELTKKIQNAKGDLHFEIFTGWEGMRKAFSKEKERYKKSRCLRINGIIDYGKHPKKVVDYFIYNMFPAREKSGMTIKKLVDEEAKKNKTEKKAHVRTLQYSSILTFNTIADLVIISVWTEEPLFFVVESDEVAKGFKENFELLWKTAKK